MRAVPELISDSHPLVLFSQEYELKGATQIRFGTLFTENEHAALVRYSEMSRSRVSFEVEDYRQTSGSLVDTLSADLMSPLDKLVFQLDEHGGLQSILNLEEVEQRWETKKEDLLERRADIPDFRDIADDYGRNLQDEEKLLTAIRDKGVHGLFFPRLRRLAAGGCPAEYSRTVLIKDYLLSTDLPVAERLSFRARGGEIMAEVVGELDRDGFDYAQFLDSSRELFGGQVKAESISFQSTQHYTLGGSDLRYTGGTRHSRFEIRGAYFRDEKLEFTLKG